MKRSSKIAGMLCFLGFSLLFLTSLSQAQGQWYPFPMGMNLGFYGFPGNGYLPLAPHQPYNYMPYGWNQPYNFDGYSYFSNYGVQPSKGYYSSYTPASSTGYYSYYPPGSFLKANWSDESDDYFPYEGGQVMELPPRNPAYPPYLKFDGTDVIMPSSSEHLNICNPESPLYYLNPSSPYYGWTPPKRFY